MALVCEQREGGVEVTGGVGGFFVSHLMFWIPIPVPNWLGWHSKNIVFFLFNTNILFFFLFMNSGFLWTISQTLESWKISLQWSPTGLKQHPHNSLPTTLSPVMEYCGPAFRKWVKSERCVGGWEDIFKCVVWVCVEKENKSIVMSLPRQYFDHSLISVTSCLGMRFVQDWMYYV